MKKQIYKTRSETGRELEVLFSTDSSRKAVVSVWVASESGPKSARSIWLEKTLERQLLLISPGNALSAQRVLYFFLTMLRRHWRVWTGSMAPVTYKGFYDFYLKKSP